MFAQQTFQLEELRPGGIFQKYKLLEQVGLGGQGVVWSAMDQGENRVVAVKLMDVTGADQAATDKQAAEMQYARMLRLRHPTILSVLDFGLIQNVRYQVSPYIPGGSLETRLKEGPIDPRSILRYAASIAAALDYLHGQDVIHRDLKPGNVLLDYSGNTYVADFGLARIVSSSTQAMHTGRGTPPYAPPEQHKLTAITPLSDIYSFGIMLYELFTRQLPWGGEKALGIQQLYSDVELPDPREIVAELPYNLTAVLRHITAADPDKRPKSAGQIVRVLYEAFNESEPQITMTIKSDDRHVRDNDARAVLKLSLDKWDSDQPFPGVSITKFALIETSFRQDRTIPIPERVQQFLLQHALIYDHYDKHWWAHAPQADVRLAVAAALVDSRNQALNIRVIEHLIRDKNIGQGKAPEKLTASLLRLAREAQEPVLRERALNALRAVSAPSSKWRATVFNAEQDAALGQLAAEDSLIGDKAARLIGQLRSEAAARAVLESENEDRRIIALLAIQMMAGSLPALVPSEMRTKVWLEWILNRITSQPLALLSAFGLGFLGVFLGYGSYVAATINLPSFMLAERISQVIYRGAPFGLLVSPAFFATRVVAERFPETRKITRVIFATLGGGVLFTLMLYVYNAVFLKTPPQITLFLAGGVLVALGFSWAGVTRTYLLKALIIFLAVFTALAGTWLIHINFSPAATELTPIISFYYDQTTWPLARIMLTLALVALPIGLLGPLGKLSPRAD